MAQLNFDASQVAPAVPMEAVPAGWYVGHMTASEMKPNSAGNGAYLEAEFTVLAPVEYAGRKFFDRLNLQNVNPVAVEIAYKTLSAICHATGVIQCPDSAMLHNRPLQIKVNLVPAGPGADGKMYDAKNEVKGYKAVEGATAAAMPAQQFAPPPVQQQYAPPVQQQQFAPPAQQQQFAAPPAQSAPPSWQPPVQQQQAAPVQQYAPPVQEQVNPAQQYAPPVQQQQAPAQAAPAAAAPAQGGAPVPPWLQGK